MSHNAARTHRIDQEVVTGTFNFDTGKFFQLPGGAIGFGSPQRCYPAKRTKGVVIPPVVATIQDLAQTTNSTIGKPFQICLPAAVSGAAPIRCRA